MIKELSHTWMPAPHYADIGYEEREGQAYWWCYSCEEHRFQEQRPGIEPCQMKIDALISRSIVSISALCLGGIYQLGGIRWEKQLPQPNSVARF